jgi:hypothetical protein
VRAENFSVVKKWRLLLFLELLLLEGAKFDQRRWLGAQGAHVCRRELRLQQLQLVVVVAAVDEAARIL